MSYGKHTLTVDALQPLPEFSMSLHQQLLRREAERRPIRIGLIGAGKFGSMYLAQVPRTPGVHLVGIADLSPDARARATSPASAGATSGRAPRASTRRSGSGTTHVGEDWQRAGRASGRSTSSSSARGIPIAAVEHCLAAYRPRQARGQRDGRGRRVLRTPARAEGRRRGRDLFARVRRPARADLRPRRLGAHLRLPGRRRPAAVTSGCRTSASPRPRRSGPTTA